MIFDTHTHYDDHAYDADRDEVLKGLKSHNVGKIVNIGADMRSSEDTVALTVKYPFVYGAVGVHPDEVGELNEEKLEELRRLAKEPKIMAIGEIGLDYHGFDRYEGKPDKETQSYWFRRQLELAVELDLPVVIHSRNGLKGAVIHCYSYSKETAIEYMDMGFYIGIGGVLTYDGQKKLTKVVQSMPLDRLLLETDCPYLTPVPIRKDRERNSSAYLNYVVDKICELRGISVEETESLSWDNAHRFYGIDKA